MGFAVQGLTRPGCRSDRRVYGSCGPHRLWLFCRGDSCMGGEVTEGMEFMKNDQTLPAAAASPQPCEESLDKLMWAAGLLPYKRTCAFCGSTVWMHSMDDECSPCRHQLILAALASLGGGLPPEQMAEQSIKAADAVLRIRAQGRRMPDAAGKD